MWAREILAHYCGLFVSPACDLESKLMTRHPTADVVTACLRISPSKEYLGIWQVAIAVHNATRFSTDSLTKFEKACLVLQAITNDKKPNGDKKVGMPKKDEDMWRGKQAKKRASPDSVTEAAPQQAPPRPDGPDTASGTDHPRLARPATQPTIPSVSPSRSLWGTPCHVEHPPSVQVSWPWGWRSSGIVGAGFTKLCTMHGV